jgi:hypothetical protein
MKPVQLLAVAFGAAVFTGLVTLVSMGFFQQKPGDQLQQALVIAGIAAGVAFIAVLLIVSLLLLAVDPADVQKPVDRPVLFPDDDTADGDSPDAAASGDTPRP